MMGIADSHKTLFHILYSEEEDKWQVTKNHHIRVGLCDTKKEALCKAMQLAEALNNGKKQVYIQSA